MKPLRLIITFIVLVAAIFALAGCGAKEPAASGSGASDGGVKSAQLGSKLNYAEPIELPDFTGADYHELMDDPQYAGKFIFVVSEIVTSGEFDEWQVVSQEPAAGTAVVDSDFRVYVTVCKGE